MAMLLTVLKSVRSAKETAKAATPIYPLPANHATQVILSTLLNVLPVVTQIASNAKASILSALNASKVNMSIIVLVSHVHRTANLAMELVYVSLVRMDSLL